jgi:hypothetical protein
MPLTARIYFSASSYHFGCIGVSDFYLVRIKANYAAKKESSWGELVSLTRVCGAAGDVC